MKRLREWIESIVFAGLKPSGGTPQSPAPAAAPGPETRWARLRERVDLWISGGADPSDPLYLTNRTTAQKLRAWSVVAVPLVILAGGAVLAFSLARPQQVTPTVRSMTPAEVVAKLPGLKDIQIESNRDVDVVEIRLRKEGEVRLEGVLRNRTDRPIAAADIVCELTDMEQTQLGTVTLHVANIAPKATKDFSVPVRRATAQYVLVRDISTH